jgi:hypothetical protein
MSFNTVQVLLTSNDLADANLGDKVCVPVTGSIEPVLQSDTSAFCN